MKMEQAIACGVEAGPKRRMNAFDKLCAAVAFLLGIIFLVLGFIGLFTGCQANFRLPPLVGVLPAFVGWGIVRAVYVAWDRPSSPVPRPFDEPDDPADRPEV